MNLDIHERDVEPILCRTCAACCRVTLSLRDTVSRYRCFLRQIGYEVLPPRTSTSADCCDKRHDARLDMGYCKYLEIGNTPATTAYRCRIYESEEMPQLCTDYNCVSWAKANDTYNEKNATLVKAQEALERLRSNGAVGTVSSSGGREALACPLNQVETTKGAGKWIG